MEKPVLEKETSKEKALERHARLSKLFKDDRLAFERERKRMVNKLINSVEDEEQRNSLRALQSDWDRKLRSTGSRHNRFVLAQSFFWDHFYEKWYPSIQQFHSFLEKKSE